MPVNSVLVSSRAPVGKTCKMTAKKKISISPSQKIGIETPVSASSILKVSNQEPRRMAEMIPAGMPTMIATKMAPNVSSIVAGKR